MTRWILPALLFACLLSAAPRAAEPQALQAGPLAFDALPGHARAVVLAFVARLRGGDPAAQQEALGVAGSALIRPERGFRYRGFGLQEVVLRELSGEAGSGASWRIAGELLWRDLVGRRAIAAFDAHYDLDTAGPRLVRAVWRPIFSALPDWRVYALPPSRAAALKPAADDGFARFLVATAEAAVAGKPDGGEGLIFTLFLMDRMGPETQCQPRLSDQETGTDGDEEVARTLSYENGWFVAGVPLSRAALDSSDPLWLKLVCWEGEGGFFSGPEEHLAGSLRVNRD